MSDTLIKPDKVEQKYKLDDGDHEKFAHYVRGDKIGDAMVFGTPVTALCGKKWVPSRAPEKFPVCPECKDIYEGMPDKS